MVCIGKSLLVLNFIDYNEKFHDPYEDEYNTNITIDNKLYNIEIIDTRGENDYLNMLDMWFSFGDGFLLVFAINDKKSFEILNLRRERILKDKHNNFIPMVLVGNKQDLSHKREIVMKKQNN